jgi:hypothetical protein
MKLDELKLTRKKLRAAETAAAAAAQREQRLVDDEQFNVRELERSLDGARDRITYDAALLALDSAKKDHALALKRLSDRQGEHAHAALEARTAEAMVVKAVDKLLLAEREAVAAECIAIHEKLTRRVADLRALVPNEFNTPVHVALDLSPEVERALNHLAPPPDATQIPVNLLQHDPAHNREAWAARRTRMIADEAVEQATAA